MTKNQTDDMTMVIGSLEIALSYAERLALNAPRKIAGAMVIVADHIEAALDRAKKAINKEGKANV